jgi:hypothetical protein
MEIYPWTLSIVALHTFPLIDERPGLYLPADYCLICMNGLLQTHSNVNERHPPPAGRRQHYPLPGTIALESSNPLNIAGFSFLTGCSLVYILNT